MAMVDTIVGIIGNVISIFLFLAPVKTFIKIIKAKSTMEFKSTPYVCTLLSVLLWTLYGLVKPAVLIITINAAGTVLGVLYVSCFLYYSDRKGRIRTSQSLLLVLGIFGIVLAASLAATNVKATRTMIAGIVSVVFSIIMYASPLRAMKMVVQTKSVTFMPFTLSAILLLNGTVWSIYSLLVKDIYIGIPNGVGMVFGILQILLYVVYMKKSKKIQLAQQTEKSQLQGDGGVKSDSTNADHAIDHDVEEGTYPKEQDMKAVHDRREKSDVQDAKAASGAAAPGFTNVPREGKTVQDSGAPPHRSPPTASGDQMPSNAQTTRPNDATMWNPLNAAE